MKILIRKLRNFTTIILRNLYVMMNLTKSSKCSKPSSLNIQIVRYLTIYFQRFRNLRTLFSRCPLCFIWRGLMFSYDFQSALINTLGYVVVSGISLSKCTKSWDQKIPVCGNHPQSVSFNFEFNMYLFNMYNCTNINLS